MDHHADVARDIRWFRTVRNRQHAAGGKSAGINRLVDLSGQFADDSDVHERCSLFFKGKHVKKRFDRIFIAYVTWAVSSYVGGVLGSFIGNPERFGMDFALVAMFVGLLYLQIIADDSLPRGLQFVMVLVTLALVFSGMIFIPENLLVVFVTLVGCGIGVALKHAFC